MPWPAAAVELPTGWAGRTGLVWWPSTSNTGRRGHQRAGTAATGPGPGGRPPAAGRTAPTAGAGAGRLAPQQGRSRAGQLGRRGHQPTGMGGPWRGCPEPFGCEPDRNPLPETCPGRPKHRPVC